MPELRVGMVTPYAGATEPPRYMFCEGQSLATADYPELFAAIGYTYGGAGANFNLPDIRGRKVIGDGVGTNMSDGSPPTFRSLGTTGGSQVMTEVPEHTHALSAGLEVQNSGPGNSNIPVGRFFAEGSADYYDSSSSATSPKMRTEEAGLAECYMPNPYLALNYIIKVTP